MVSLFDSKAEFRPLVLYLPAVMIYGIIANWNIPTLDVIWDMVLYKHLAYGLHHISSFHLRNHFPMPPLYPLMLSIGFFASNYLWVEYIQSWINPMLYFLTLFPLYRFSRFLLNPGASAGVCLLFLFYPASIYTQMSMSENLAAPLILWAVLYSTQLLLSTNPALRDGILLGILTSALILTRVQLLVIALGLLSWVFFQTIRQNKNPGAASIACSLAFTLTLTVWWGMGYFDPPFHSPVYAEIPPVEWGSALKLFPILFLTLGTAIWLEGAAVIPSFLFLRFFHSLFKANSFSKKQKEIIHIIFFFFLIQLASAAGFLTLRKNLNPNWLTLRFTFYINLVSLPILVEAVLVGYKTLGSRMRFGFLFLLINLFFILGFLTQEGWSRLTDPHNSYIDAPTLDFIYQINRVPLKTVAFFFGVSLFVGMSLVILRRFGWILFSAALLYIQLSTLDYFFQYQQNIIQNWWGKDIHAFCAQLETGRWKEIPLFCEEEGSAFLSINISYWLHRYTEVLPPGAPRPKLPYLLLTPNIHTDGKLEFQSDKLRAYLFDSPTIPSATG